MDRRDFVKSSLAFGVGLSQYSFGSVFLGSPRRTYISSSLSRICFGSCNDQGLSQEFWVNIAQNNPDLWVWLGDNIYADYASPEERQAEYLALKKNSYYEAFANSVPMVGTWDDHDYAYDNADGNYLEKEKSQEAFCNFLGLPTQHILRSSQGVYQSFIYGGESERRVHLILLDLRYFKEGDRLLGEEQWQWLAKELANSSGDLVLIGSSLAVLSEFTGFGLEGWAAFKQERRRFFEILDLCPHPVVLLSGDRHYTEISRKNLRSGKVIYEFMASGLTHNTPVGLPNRYRLAGRAGENNFGKIDLSWEDDKVFVGFEALSTNRRGRKLYSHGAYLDLEA